MLALSLKDYVFLAEMILMFQIIIWLLFCVVRDTLLLSEMDFQICWQQAEDDSTSYYTDAY